MAFQYGLSREYVHFQQILETHLPLIIDIKLDQDIEEDLTQTSHKFRSAIQKFLKNKRCFFNVIYIINLLNIRELHLR